jgi:hypothetical protein
MNLFTIVICTTSSKIIIYSSEAEAIGFFPAPPCSLAYSSSLYFLTHPEPSVRVQDQGSNNESK